MNDYKRLERIENKQDDANEHLASIDTTLAAQHVSLLEHMRRTSILEQDMRPVRRHVAMMEGAFKFIGVVATILAIAGAIHLLLK